METQDEGLLGGVLRGGPSQVSVKPSWPQGDGWDPAGRHGWCRTARGWGEAEGGPRETPGLIPLGASPTCRARQSLPPGPVWFGCAGSLCVPAQGVLNAWWPGLASASGRSAPLPIQADPQSSPDPAPHLRSLQVSPGPTPPAHCSDATRAEAFAVPIRPPFQSREAVRPRPGLSTEARGSSLSTSPAVPSCTCPWPFPCL